MLAEALKEGEDQAVANDEHARMSILEESTALPQPFLQLLLQNPSSGCLLLSLYLNGGISFHRMILYEGTKCS